MKLLIALKKVYQTEGQTLQQFNEEQKKLTEKDRADFVEMFNGMPADEAKKLGIEQPVSL